jgi:hypothetical protein
MAKALTVAAASMTVREARDLYLAENGFSTDEYTKEKGWLVIAGFRIEFRNSPARRRLLPFHDLHHVALGFGTDVAGEFEVSAWEARAGLPEADAMVRFLVWQGTLGGFVTHPVRTLAAFRANHARRSLVSHPLDYETALAMTVGELRAHLGIPESGLATRPPRSHAAVS